MYSVRRTFRTATLVLAVATTCSALPQPVDNAPNLAPNAIPGEIVVKFKKGAKEADLERGLKLGRLKPKRHLQTGPMHDRGDDGLYLAETDDSVAAAVKRLQQDPAIDYVEPNLRYQHHATANDPYVVSGHLWGLYGDAGNPTNLFGSQALEAWTAGHTGTNKVVVAVIDEGIDVAHPDLAPNIWANPFDPADGRDNDGNGYIDDVHGWDFAANKNVVFDPAGDSHGTHVAGTIGAKGGNGIGIAGVNWNVTIISGKFLSAGGGNTLDAVEAIDYFVDLKKRHGLNLVAINASWGGAGYSQALHDAVIRAAKAGILFIAAAGNEGLNNDAYGSYPCNLDTRKGTSTESAASYDAVLSVAAIDNKGALASFSNYGATQVDIGAPGVGILSAYPNSYLGYMDGTSMATPHVTGAAALYASTHPGATAASIRQALLSSATATPSLVGRTVSGARLNIGGTVIAPTPVAPIAPAIPASVTGLSINNTLATVAGSSTVTLRWNATTGATSYKVKRASNPSGPWTTVAAVTATTFTQNVTANGSSYFYTVVASNSAGDSPNATALAATPANPVPKSLVASAVSSTQVQLRWTDASSDEQGFKLEYWTGSNWAHFGTAVAGSTSVNVTGVASRRTYFFRIRAYNDTVNTAYSNTASTTTP